MLLVGPYIDGRYVLTSPFGTRAVINDRSDADYVGVLTEITGVDSPEIREEAENISNGDGGLHGAFYFGRRPVTLAGKILNPINAVDRDTRVSKLRRAVLECMRADGTLEWTTSDGQIVFFRCRVQQPMRISGTWQKEYQVSLVANDPLIYAKVPKFATLSGISLDPVADGLGFDTTFDTSFGDASPQGALAAYNDGTATTYPVITITGPGSNPVIANYTTGRALRLNYTLGVGDTVVIDMANRTVVLNGLVNRYSAVNVSSDWWGLFPGDNDIRFAFDQPSAAAVFRIDWRDAVV